MDERGGVGSGVSEMHLAPFLGAICLWDENKRVRLGEILQGFWGLKVWGFSSFGKKREKRAVFVIFGGGEVAVYDLV